MATNKVYTEAVVTLNDNEAKAHIEELKKKGMELRLELARMSKIDLNSKEFKKIQKQLDANKKSQEDWNESMKKFSRTINDLNGSSLNELQSAAKKLYNQMRRLKPGTDEFVAASSKLKEVRLRMKEIEDKARSTQSLFGSFFKKIGWKLSWAAAAGAIIKFGKDMIAQTQLVGDRWRAETTGWKDAYNTFVADLASGKGWKEMISHMREAYRVGKEWSTLMDELFERNNSLAIQESEANLEIEKQKQIMNDVNRTHQERIAAAEEIRRIEGDLAEQRKSIAYQEEQAQKKRLQTRTELSDAELDAFVRDYNQNRELIHQAQEYTEELRKREAAVKGLQSSVSTQGGIAFISALEEEKKALDDFMASADASVVRWAGIVDKYNLGNDEMVKNYVDARLKMTDAETKFYQHTARSERTANTLRKQLSQEAVQSVSGAYQDALKKAEQAMEERKMTAKQAYADGTIGEQEYQDRLTEIQRQSLEERIALAGRFNESAVALQSQLLDLAIADKDRLKKLMEDLEKDAAAALDEALKATETEISAFIDGVDAELEDWLDRWKDLVDRADEISREINPAAALREDMAGELTALDEMLSANLVSEEDYQKKRAEIVRHYNKEILAAQMEPYRKGIETAQGYIGQLGSFMTSVQEAASARMEARMQAELTAAGDNAERREQIEADYEQKKLDLQKKYANINMGIEIAKAIAAGALAVMQGFAELGPVGGAVSAALIAATTAAQVAVIVAQRNAIMSSSVSSTSSGSTTGSRVATEYGSGYSEGGFTDKAPDDTRAVGIVHANEWVAPAAMVRANPITFARLEAARRSGNYSAGTPGFASGGETTSGTIRTASDGISADLLKRNTETMERILAALPFPAYVVMSSLNAKNELAAEMKKITGKS